MQRLEYHTIVKIFKSQASASERDQLARWIRASSENKAEFRTLKSIWEEYGKHHESYPVDPLKDYPKLEQQFLKATKRSSLIYKVAATVALLCLIGITIFQLSPTDSKDQLVYASEMDGKTIRLPDGSRVTLRVGSKIILSQDFDKEQRSLELFGEAFFEVAKNPNKPFLVKNRELTVEVFGTTFLIKPSLDKTEVALFSGEVDVYTDQQRLKLIPNQTAVLQDALTKTGGINNHILSWQTNKLMFEKEKLSDVFKALENHYRVEIESSRQIEEKRLTASFEDQSLEEVLLIISNIHHLQTQKKANNHYYLLPK